LYSSPPFLDPAKNKARSFPSSSFFSFCLPPFHFGIRSLKGLGYGPLLFFSFRDLKAEGGRSPSFPLFCLSLVAESQKERSCPDSPPFSKTARRPPSPSLFLLPLPNLSGREGAVARQAFNFLFLFSADPPSEDNFYGPGPLSPPPSPPPGKAKRSSFIFPHIQKRRFPLSLSFGQ